MKSKKIISVLMLLTAAVCTQARSWKIGPNSVVGMDFASINAAMASENVNAGDTLFLDQYYSENAVQTVMKAVVIIGTGYDTSLTDEQVVATLTNNLELKADNAVVKSVRLSSIYLYNDNCTIDRCYASYIRVSSADAGMNHIYSCYIAGRIEGFSSASPSKLDIQNTVIYDNDYNATAIHNIAYLIESIINNNVIYKNYSTGNSNQRDCYCLSSITNSQITNNLIYGYHGYSYNGYSYNYDRCFTSGVYASGSGNSIEHNVLSGSINNFPTNKSNWREKWNTIFVQTGNYSAYYKIKTETADNPAIGYATDGGDCGVHGGMFGCPSGGRPQYIPYFSKVTVGSRTEDGKLPVSVTIKIQDE